MATLFPIGTIVKLDDGDQNMMVAGYGGANAQGQVFDYIGLPCPVGIIDKNMTVLFNDAQIETLRYMGYIDAPTQAYIAKVEEAGREHLPVFKDAGRGVDADASPNEVAGVSANVSDGAGAGEDADAETSDSNASTDANSGDGVADGGSGVGAGANDRAGAGVGASGNVDVPANSATDSGDSANDRATSNDNGAPSADDNKKVKSESATIEK